MRTWRIGSSLAREGNGSECALIRLVYRLSSLGSIRKGFNTLIGLNKETLFPFSIHACARCLK